MWWGTDSDSQNMDLASPTSAPGSESDRSITSLLGIGKSPFIVKKFQID
jgi:hypothetical protein